MAALNEAALSEATRAAIERVGRALGAVAGTAPTTILNIRDAARKHRASP